MAKASKAAKDWWKGFFGPLAGEVMFVPQEGGRTEAEVATIRRRLKPRAGARILDVPCGTGRHALLFARDGFAVTGVDFSRAYVAKARASAAKARLGSRAKFLRGDMRHLTKHVGTGGFDLALSLFNSFGYFERRADDARVLREVFRALAPGGVFLLNTLNEGGVRKRLALPRQIGHEPMRNVFVIDGARYDPAARRSHGRWTIIDARKSRTKIMRLKLAQNVYSHAELKRMLRAAGFRILRTWGLLHGTRFTPDSWHQTIAAQKPARRR